MVNNFLWFLQYTGLWTIKLKKDEEIVFGIDYDAGSCFISLFN